MSHVSFIDSFLRTFFKIILRLVQYKNSTPLWSHPIPRDQELTKFNLHLSEDVSTRFSFFNQMVSKKNIFFKCLQIEISRHYLSLKEGAAFHFNKLESSLLESSPPKDALNQD